KGVLIYADSTIGHGARVDDGVKLTSGPVHIAGGEHVTAEHPAAKAGAAQFEAAQARLEFRQRAEAERRSRRGLCAPAHRDPVRRRLTSRSGSWGSSVSNAEM